MSTDAIVAFGIVVPEDCKLIDIIDNSADNGVEWDDIDKEVSFFSNSSRLFEMISHCCSSDPMWILALTHTKVEASRGCPEKLDNMYQPQPAEVESLKAKFKELTGLDGEPSWLLFVDTEL